MRDQSLPVRHRRRRWEPHFAGQRDPAGQFGHQLGAYFGRLLPLFSHTAAAYPLDFLKYGKTYGVFLILGLLCSTSLPAYLYRRFKSTWVGAVILAVLFWLCLYCLSKGMNDPFMYFRF